MGQPFTGKATFAKIDASANNIPTTYGEGAGSTLLTGLINPSHIALYNTSSTDIAVSLYSGETGATAATDALVVPKTGTLALDNVSIGTRVYIRSLGSAIATGILYATVW